MAEHTVKAFDEDITRLRGLIAEMGGLAEVAIQEAMQALVTGDEELAAGVVERDLKLDRLESEVDELAVRVIALRGWARWNSTLVTSIRIMAMAQNRAAPSTMMTGQPMVKPPGLTATTMPKKPIAAPPTRASVNCSLRKMTARTVVRIGAT